MPEMDYAESTCVITIHIGGMSTGLNVDCVFEVPTTQDERDPLRPKSDRVTDRGYVRSIGENPKPYHIAARLAA